MAKTLTSTVTGVEFSGTGALNPSVFSFNSLKGSTINVYSNGLGKKRGVLVSGTNQASTRDMNIFVAQPPDTDSSGGSYVGIETNDVSNTGSIEVRSTTVGVVVPILPLQTYTASDILQTTPATITDPTYLASSGIQVGPGTDLVTKSAGSKGFSTYVYPTIIYYGLKGTIRSASGSPSYMWPGTQAVTSGTNGFPDPGLPAAFFRVQQPALISGLSCALTLAPSSGNNVTFKVYVTPIATGIMVPTLFTAVLNGTDIFGSFYNASYRCNTGDRIHLQISYTDTPSNNAHDATVQIDLF